MTSVLGFRIAKEIPDLQLGQSCGDLGFHFLGRYSLNSWRNFLNVALIVFQCENSKAMESSRIRICSVRMVRRCIEWGEIR